MAGGGVSVGVDGRNSMWLLALLRTPAQLLHVRKQLKLSRALFAVYLRTNVRMLENWEQGRAKPNAQAALLINMVRRYPDTVERLAAI